jgi:hypothetical protein
MALVRHPLTLVAVFTWLGLVVGIVFIASWLKYNAFGVSLPVGLSLDKVMFQAMVRVEWVFACAMLADLLLGRAPALMLAAAALLIALLAIQTFWLQPARYTDSLAVFHGQGDPGAGLRMISTMLEVVKVSLLAVLGIIQFQRTTARAGVSAPYRSNTRS